MVNQMTKTNKKRNDDDDDLSSSQLLINPGSVLTLSKPFTMRYFNRVLGSPVASQPVCPPQ